MAFKYRRRDTGRMLLYALVVFVATAGYFHKTSAWLPMGAGPDASAHNNVSAFIYYNGRLPVYPKDEIALEYTHYGGTRAFRPPLSYLVSAATARLLGETPKEQLPWRLRKGSVLLGALAVTATFFALSLYFSSYGIGLLGALLIALMPQFSFIASYNNDDTSAILSATLVFTAFIRILRLGINIRNVLLLGLACNDQGPAVSQKPFHELSCETAQGGKEQQQDGQENRNKVFTLHLHIVVHIRPDEHEELEKDREYKHRLETTILIPAQP